MDNNIENNQNIVTPTEPKKKGNKGLIVFLILIILGLVGYITYDKVLKDKIFNKVEPKKTEKIDNNNEKVEESNNTVIKNNNSDENANELKDINGTLSTDKDDSVVLTINGKKVTLYYNLLDNTDVGTHLIKFNSKEIFKQGAADGIGTINYYVFKASDNKQYLFLTYKQWGMFGILLDDNGEVLSKINEYSDDIDCFMLAKNNADLITLKDGNIYYYQYKKDSYKEGVGVKLQEVKLTINNNKVNETLTGKEIDGDAGQCS